MESGPVVRRLGGMGAVFWLMTIGTGILRAAETSAAPRENLEHSIQGAEELGNFSRVQVLRLRLADWSADHGDYVAAARQYELLLAARPSENERVKFYKRLGDMRSALGDWSRAIAAYGDALHDDPKDWDAGVSRARAFDHVELNAAALDQYAHCIKLKPDRPEPYAEIGAVYQRLSYLDKAIENYRASQKLKAQPELYLKIADCYLREGDMNRASAELQLAKSKLPLAEYDVRLGDISRKRGDGVKAAAAWDEALRIDPKRDDVRLKLALVDDELHRGAAADREMQTLLKTYPYSPLVHFLHGWILYRRGNTADARAEAQNVQTLQPMDGVEHYNELLLKEINS